MKGQNVFLRNMTGKNELTISPNKKLINCLLWAKFCVQIMSWWIWAFIFRKAHIHMLEDVFAEH